MDALLITSYANTFYLSGFTGSYGFLVVTRDSVALGVDFISLEQAKSETSDVEIVRIGRLPEGMADLLGGRSIRRLGFESEHVTFAMHGKLVEAIRDLGIELVPSEGHVEALRMVKDEAEVEEIRKACILAARAGDYLAKTLEAGMTEKSAAWAVEKFLRENGSESMPFEIIVASGPNGALPHARPSERRISAGETIVIDLGAKINGYCSDMSRTLWVGELAGEMAAVYDVVRRAQSAALDGVRPGMTGEQADTIAREVIEDAGYGHAFGHALGHGVGVEVHERPRLAQKAADVLEPGMVFTIEPGVYLPGTGGVRIEDTVIMRNDRVEILTTDADKQATEV